MTGARLAEFIKQRVGAAGIPDERLNDVTELYNYATWARNAIRRRLALDAPVAVRELLALEQDPADRSVFQFPAAAKDPLRVLLVREAATRQPLRPRLDERGLGRYEWVNTRKLRYAEDRSPSGGLEVYYVPVADPITQQTAEADMGLPVPCHEAIGFGAAVLWLTANEESDARSELELFRFEMDQLLELYAEFDPNEGMAVLDGMLVEYGEHFGDMLY